MVEALVVLSIIVVLIALILPAVQQARETARRSSCQNNLRELALGFNQHVSQHGFYPTGGWGASWSADSSRGYTRRQPGGWYYNVLAFIDEDNIRLSTSAVNIAVRTCICPTRRRVPAAANTDYAANAGSVVQSWPPSGAPYNNQSLYGPGFNIGGGPSSEAVGDHLPNLSALRGPAAPWNGTPCPPPGWPPTDPSIPWPPPLIVPPGGAAPPPNPPLPLIADLCWPDWSTGANPAVPLCNGISFLRSQITPGHITDGTSNTILLGEKSAPQGTTVDGSAYVGHSSTTLRWTASPPVPDMASNGNCFGGPHPEGTNFVFCDGSVRSLRFTIDASTFSRLGSRNDNMPVNVTQFE